MAALMLLTITFPCMAGTENSEKSTWLAVDRTEIVFDQSNIRKGAMVNVENKSSASRTIGVEMPNKGLIIFQVRRKIEQTKIPYEDLGQFTIPSNSGVFIVLIPDSAQAKALDGKEIAIKLYEAGSVKEIRRIPIKMRLEQNTGAREIEALLKVHGAAVIEDKHENTDLILAIRFGDLQEFKRLLDSGADVNAKDQYGNTAVMWAADRGRLEALKMLLHKKADVNAKNKRGWTALMKAVWEGRVEAAKILLDGGADINAKEESGETALMNAARSGDADMVKLLLARGADTSAKNRDGLTAMKKARENGHTDIVGLFRIHGAKE